MFRRVQNDADLGSHHQYIQFIKANDQLSLDNVLTKGSHIFATFSIDEINNISTQQAREDNLISDRITLLHAAAYYNSLECFVFLHLEIGIPIRSLSARSFYALHYACYHGSKEVVAYILENDPEQIHEVKNNSLFCFAINGCSHSILEALFEKGATRKKPLSKQDDPIHIAISTDNYECCRVLMRHSDEYRSDYTPAIIAAKMINPELVEYFVKGPSDLLYDERNEMSIFTVIFEVAKGDIFKHAIIKWLNNFDVEIEPPYIRNTNGVCHWVCKMADKETADLMLRTKNVIINRIGVSDHLGPYYLANKTNITDKTIIDMLDLLISYKFDINFQPSIGFCEPVLKCFLKTIKIRYAVIEYLFEHRANLELPWTSDKKVTILTEIKRRKNDKKLMDLFHKYYPEYK